MSISAADQYSASQDDRLVASAQSAMPWLDYCTNHAGRFLEKHLFKDPVIYHGEHSRFADLFSSHELWKLLEAGAIPLRNITVLKKDKIAPRKLLAAASSRIDAGYGAADGERARAFFRQGYTLRIFRIQKFAARIFSLCHGLEAELSYGVSANAYLTPAASQGMPAHYDDHDVIVLQISGAKEWHIFDRATDNPKEARNLTPSEAGEPRIRAVLQAGESLYVPRGFAHEAAATGRSSLHLSVGLFPAIAADLLRHAVSELADSPQLAQPLRPGFATDPHELALALARAAGYLRQRCDEPAVGCSTAESFCRSWPRMSTEAPA